MSRVNRKRDGEGKARKERKVAKRRFEVRRPRAKLSAAVAGPRTATNPIASSAYLFVLLLVVAAVVVAFAYHLHVRFEGVRLGYETSQARAERARLVVERRELRLELATLKAPQRVEAEAREKLGMEIPDHRRIIPIGKKRKTLVASGGAR